MFQLPPIPTWDALHPIVVHFPIALLLFVPAFVVLGLIVPRWRVAMWSAAFVTLLSGVAFAFVATSTGDAAEKFAEGSPAVDRLVHEHEELAEKARNAFLVLVPVLGALLAWAWRGKGSRRWPLPLAGVVYLALHLGASLILANAAHHGGLLVHAYGVRADIKAPPLPPPDESIDGD